MLWWYCCCCFWIFILFRWCGIFEMWIWFGFVLFWLLCIIWWFRCWVLFFWIFIERMIECCCISVVIDSYLWFCVWILLYMCWWRCIMYGRISWGIRSGLLWWRSRDLIIWLLWRMRVIRGWILDLSIRWFWLVYVWISREVIYLFIYLLYEFKRFIFIIVLGIIYLK